MNGRGPRRAAACALLGASLVAWQALAGRQASLFDGANQVPAPSGPFAVGRVEYRWTDSSRTEPYASPLVARREIAVFVWYPAELPSPSIPAPYIPHLAAIALAIGDSGMASEFGRAREAIAAAALRSHSVADAPLRRAGRPFPVLIFSHGFGESSLTYSAQLEDLASHGYVVFGIEHPYDAYAVALDGSRVVAFAKGKWDSARARSNGAVNLQLAQVPLRAADIRFVLDRIALMAVRRDGNAFAGALDLQRVGAFGHSLGGVAAASACRADARVRACLNEDADDEGRPYDGGPEALPIKQPFLFFATGHSIYVSARTPPPTDEALVGMKLTRPQYDSITALYQRNQDRALATMPGGAVRIMAEAADFTHRTFIDLKALQAPDSSALARQIAYLGTIRWYVRAFFDATLLGKRTPALEREGPIDSLVTIDHFGGRSS